MTEFNQRAEKILTRLNDLAAISEDPSCLTRTFGSEAFINGCQLVKTWMQEAGLKTRIDNIGNVRGRLETKLPTEKTFVLASHIDTVANSGKFDGPLGVLIGLDLLEQLSLTKTELPFNLELIAFADEEGVRFHTTYLGSKAVAGSFDSNLLDKKDAAGTSLKEVIKTLGGDPEKLGSDSLAVENWLGYFEIHIEQGPVLYEKNVPVALVTAIAGQNRIEIPLKGMAGHAGTVPMNMRRDALTCAAELIIEIEKFAQNQNGQIVATVGKLNIPNPASNVIPGLVTLTLDLRSANENTLKAANYEIRKFCNEISQKRKIEMEWDLVQSTEPVSCSAKLNELLEAAISESGYEVIKLVSGAGHDAVPISKVAPVTMLFVRCFEGISHNPLENAELTDIAAAIQVSEKFVHHLMQEHLQQQHIGIP